VGQQPNIPLTIADLPRATPKPAAPRRWRPERPGEITTPDEMPWGGLYGTPGPDAGYALKLLRQRDLPGSDDDRADVEAALLAVISARGSALGRAPVAPDVDRAIEILGLDDPARVAGLDGIAHDHTRLRSMLDGLPRDALMAPLGDGGPSR
jgi:hypothetical protein